MTPPVTIHIPGHPEPWRRARSHGARRFKDAATVARAAVILAAARAVIPRCPSARAYAVEVLAIYARPRSRPAIVTPAEWASGEALYRPSVPDADNVAKSVLDALQVAWMADDATVVSLSVGKVWAARGGRDGMVVVVTPLDGLRFDPSPTHRESTE